MDHEESFALLSFVVVIAIVVALLSVPTDPSSTRTAPGQRMTASQAVAPIGPSADPYRDVARQRLSERLPAVYGRTVDLASPSTRSGEGRVTYTWHFLEPAGEETTDVRTVSLTLHPPRTTVESIRIR